MDFRLRRHAELLIGHCTDVRRGDNVLVRAPSVADELVVVLYEQFGKRGARPSLSWRHSRAGRAYARVMDEDDFETDERELAAMEETDVGILVAGSTNAAEQSDVDPSKMGETIHVTLGNAMEECVPDDREFNESARHVDMSVDMSEDARLEVDGRVVQRDGIFTFEDEFDK